MLCFADAEPHRIAARMIAGALTGTIFFGAAGTAMAAPAPPGCTAADLAKASATVASETSAYLSAHPDVNEFYTNLKNAQHDEVQSQVKSYMDAHPQVNADLQRIRQPRTDLQHRCGWLSDDVPG